MVMKESDSALGPATLRPTSNSRASTARRTRSSPLPTPRRCCSFFTCNHCPYAQAKFELLNELSAEYDDVAVVGINPNDAEEYPDDSFEKMQEFVAEGKSTTTPTCATTKVRRSPASTARSARRTRSFSLGARRNAPRRGEQQSPRAEDGEFELVYQGRLDDALNPDDEPTRFHIREAIDAVLAGEAVDLEWQPSRGCSIKWKDE